MRPSEQLQKRSAQAITVPANISEDSVRLALPDGHQQKHMVNILNKAGIKIKDYPSATGIEDRRLEYPGFTVKVIRPQDMPLQVANGNLILPSPARTGSKNTV